MVPGRSWGSAAGSTTSARSVTASGAEATATTKSAPSSAACREVAVGEVVEGIRSEQHQRTDPLAIGASPPGGGRCENRRRVPAAFGGHRTPGVLEPAAAVVEHDPAGQHSRRHSHVDRAVHVAAPQCRQEPGVRERSCDRLRRFCDQLTGFRERGATEQDDDALGREQPARLGKCLGVDRSGGVAPPDECLGNRDDLARPGAQGRGGVAGQRALLRCDLDQGGRTIDDRGTEPQEEHGHLLAEIAREHEDRVRGGHLVDGRPRQRGHHLGRQSVAELRVDRVGAQDPLCELRPGVGTLVGEARAAHHRDRARTGTVRHLSEAVGDRLERLVPRSGDELALLAHQRLDEAVLAVDRVAGEATLVAEPALVDRVGIDAEQTGHPIRGRLHRNPASHRAGGAGRLDLVEVPGPSGEPVGRRCQRAHRADLHGVPREVRGEGELGEDPDLEQLAAADEVDLGLTGDLVGEAHAPAALDAPLAVEQHELRDGDRLLEVALLLDEASLAGAIGEGLVLQRALAALVAHGAVERVIDEEELEDTVLGLLDPLGRGVHRHPVLHLDEAARLERGAARPTDLDEAHPAHADRGHARVVAEPRDEGSGSLRGGDEQIALPRLDLASVEGEGQPVVGGGPGGGRVSHKGSRLP